MISGSSAIVRASATRRDIPPDNSDGIRFSTPRRPTAFSFNKTKSRITASGSCVSSRIGKAILSNTDKSVNSAPCWNNTPIRRRCSYNSSAEKPAKSRPSIKTCPDCGRICPVISLISVVLPLPEPPITAAKLPCGILKLMFFRIGRSPYAKATSFISIKGKGLMCRQNDRFDGVYFKAYRKDGQFSDGIRTVSVVKMPCPGSGLFTEVKNVIFQMIIFLKK